MESNSFPKWNIGAEDSLIMFSLYGWMILLGRDKAPAVQKLGIHTLSQWSS